MAEIKGSSIILGDCVSTMGNLRLFGAQFDSCVCDPPYHLTSVVKRFGKEGAAPAKQGNDGAFQRVSKGFMGQSWDGGDISYRPETWKAAYDVLKPGAHLVVFGGTKSFHRIACAIEDAGFELRDTLMWIYGSGMPKSHSVAKGIDSTLGKKGDHIVTGSPVKRMIPGADQDRDGWIKDNGRMYEPGDYAPATEQAEKYSGWGTSLKPAFEPIILARKPLEGTVAQNVMKHGVGGLNIDACRIGDSKGRWPANVMHDGSDDVVSMFPITTSGEPGTRTKPSKSVALGDYAVKGGVEVGYGDTGSAARFFYSGKANAKDRAGSNHPTVKPVDLIRYLMRLVTPPGGTVLDCFAGSGTAGEAAYLEGFKSVLIEQSETYFKDICNRMNGLSA